MPDMEKKTPNIRILAENQAKEALDFLAASGGAYSGEALDRLNSGITSGEWRFVMADMDGQAIGCFYLNFAPKYHVYRALKVPELQDLRVLPGFRQQGLGRALVEYGEAMARDMGAPGLGVSVGLSSDYGAAQRLYMRMGYMPDGNGITYDRQVIDKGQRIAIDDDASLMLVKLF